MTDQFEDILNNVPSESEPLLTGGVDSRQPPGPSPFQICVPLFFFVLSVSIAIVPLQQWLLLYICRQSLSKPSWELCRGNDQVQALTARFNILLTLCAAVPALFVGPVIGVISDRYGRRVALMFPILSTMVGMIAFILVSYLDIGLWFLVLSRILQGVLGYWPVMLSVTMSYIADTTQSGDRSQIFVSVEAFIFLAFAIGPILGGYLTRFLGNAMYVFWVSLFMQTSVGLYTIFVLPESLRIKVREEFPESQPSIAHAIYSSFGSLIFIFRKASSRTFISLLVGIVALVASFSGRSETFFYAAYKFGWDSYDEGEFLLFGSLSRIMYMVAVFPLLIRVFSSLNSTQKGKITFDLNVIRLGLLVSGISTLIMGLAKEPSIWFTLTLFDGFGTLASPTIRSLLSKSVANDVQGQLFSGVQFLEQLTGLICGIIFPNIWAMTVGTAYTNLFFFIVAGLYIFGVSVLIFAKSDQIGDNLECDV